MFEDWLFVERVTYREAQERAERLWNVKGSEVSVGRYYRRIERARMMEDMEVALETSAEVQGNKAKTEEMWKSGMKVVAMQFLETAMARGDVKVLEALGRLILKSEEREIQKGRLELAQERFKFNAAKAALKQLPLATEMRRQEYELEERKVVAMQEAMFGDEAPNVERLKAANDGENTQIEGKNTPIAKCASC